MKALSTRATQCSRLLNLLQSRQGQWVPLPEILSLGFAQFGARLLEIRREGHTILNKTEHRNGRVFSWYQLVLEHDRGNSAVSSNDRCDVNVAASLFGDISKDRTYAE